MTKKPGRIGLDQFSWAMYDFANTIFSMNVVSLHFALWVTREQGGSELDYSIIYSASVLAVILLAPVLGRAADLTDRRKAFLVLATLFSAGSTCLIGLLNELRAGLALFFLANLGFQLAIIFYDSLLPSVARRGEYGRISGLGVSLGYLGSLAGIALAAPFVQHGGEIVRSRAFLPTGVFFFLFAVPCFLFVRERRSREAGEKFSLQRTLDLVRSRRGVPRFLTAMFFVQNAVNTVILFMAVYSVEVGRLNQNALYLFFALATTCAFLSAYLQGVLVDRIGPKKVFLGVLWIWIAGLTAALFGRTHAYLWVAGCLIGVGLGGLWTSSRALLLSLIPERESATFFGLNVFTGRLAALLGPLVWGSVVSGLIFLGTLRYRIAIAILIGFVVCAWAVARKIPDEAPAAGHLT
jgi:UMF1 family MFS transporter